MIERLLDASMANVLDMERELVYKYFIDKNGDIDAPSSREYIIQGFEQADDGSLICQKMFAKLDDHEVSIIETRTK